MARHKNVVTRAFYGSNDFESYVNHFELLLKPQKSGKKDTRKSYSETIIAFRKHFDEKPVVFRGRLAIKIQQPP